MTTERISPYLILGIDYGTALDEAREAFAMKVRAVRADSSLPFDVADLTWALNEVEHATEDPSASIEFFRVPANRASFPETQPGELFNPVAEALERRTPAVSAEERDALLARATIVELLV